MVVSLGADSHMRRLWPVSENRIFPFGTRFLHWGSPCADAISDDEEEQEETLSEPGVRRADGARAVAGVPGTLRRCAEQGAGRARELGHAAHRLPHLELRAQGLRRRARAQGAGADLLRARRPGRADARQRQPPDAGARLRLRAARRAPQLHQHRLRPAGVPGGHDAGVRRRRRVTALAHSHSRPAGRAKETTMTTTGGKRGPTRRTLVHGAGALAGLAALGAPLLSRAQADKIRIGHLTPMTGFLGALGEYAVMGVKMATDEINAAGGVLGRQLDVMSEDSVNPQVAANKAQRMIERDSVAALMGEISSASALTISQTAARAKKLFMSIGARSDVLRGKDCNRYTFHVDIPVTVMVNAVGQSLVRDNMVKGKKVFSLTADYLFGHDLARAAKKFYAANGGNPVGDELVPTDAAAFSPYLLKIRQARPDFVSSNLAGNQVTNFVKQYAEFGLPYPVVGFNLNTADAWAAGEGNLGGIWPTVWHHELQTPGSKAFVAAFLT